MRTTMRYMTPILIVTAVACLSIIRLESSGLLRQFLVPAEESKPNGSYRDQDEKRIQKFYAIHIGPSKTGTSAIQKNMAKNPFEENTFGADKDNLIYVGKRHGYEWPDPNGKKEIRRVAPLGITDKTIAISATDESKAYKKAVKCMQQLLEDYYVIRNNTSAMSVNVELETDEETRFSLRKRFIDNCWIQSIGRDAIDFSYMLNSSIVDSDESYSYKLKHLKKFGNQFRIFDILGYERLVVVGAYRRYADWLVSAFTQSNKRCMVPNLEGLKKDYPCRKFEPFLARHIGMPNHVYRVRDMYEPVLVTLPEIKAVGPSKLEAKILNYFQLSHTSNQKEGDASSVKAYNSISTELYCDAFGAGLAPHTCAYAQKSEMEKPKDIAALGTNTGANTLSLVANKGRPTDSMYQQIVAAGYRFGFLLPSDKEFEEYRKRKEACQFKGFWCDSLRKCKNRKGACNSETKTLRGVLDKITSGGNITIVGTNTSNITMFRELASHHNVFHNRTWIDSLPIMCPQRSQLEQLLEKSLAMEELVMPDFFASPLGKEEHSRIFWNVWFQKKKVFCWVDIDRLFQGATSWDVIINERMVSHDWGLPIEYAQRN